MGSLIKYSLSPLGPCFGLVQITGSILLRYVLKIVSKRPNTVSLIGSQVFLAVNCMTVSAGNVIRGAPLTVYVITFGSGKQLFPGLTVTGINSVRGALSVEIIDSLHFKL